jgi:hypothetical protein
MTYYIAAGLGFDSIRIRRDDPTRWAATDRSGAWHSAAFWIAWADQHVDRDPATEPIREIASREMYFDWKLNSVKGNPPWANINVGKYVDYGAWDIRNRFHFRHDSIFPVKPGSDIAAEPMNEAIQDKTPKGKVPDLMLMGIGLHAYQDSWSHQGYISLVGHADDGDYPDEAWHDDIFPRAKEMAEATYKKLKEFRDLQLPGAKPNRTWDEMSKDIFKAFRQEGSEMERRAYWRNLIKETYRLDASYEEALAIGALAQTYPQPMVEKAFLTAAGRVRRADDYKPFTGPVNNLKKNR